MKNEPLICVWLSYVVFLSSAWKNVGMTWFIYMRRVLTCAFAYDLR